MASTLYFYQNSSIHSFEPLDRKVDQFVSPLFQTDPLGTTNPLFESRNNMLPIGKVSRMRRKSASPLEQVKHRRTRSGCLTCRARRVKCDETRPMCERCRKGGRECSFPEPTSKSMTSKSKKDKSTIAVTAGGPASSPEVEAEDHDEEGEEYADYLDDDTFSYTDDLDHRLSIPNFAEPPAFVRNSASFSPIVRFEEGSPSPSDSNDNTFASTSPFYNLHTVSTLHLMTERKMSSVQLPIDLPIDVRYYLDYYRQNISSFHYLWKLDPSNFFQTSLLEHALSCDALLYAIVAFSAFHYHVDNNSNHYGDFLEYHNKAVTLLRASLNEQSDPDIAQLLTILQIATFEERLGDWASLMQHRRGAHMMLISLFDTQTIFETAESTVVFAWFSRLDILVTQTSAEQPLLDECWYEDNKSYCQAQVANFPDDSIAILQEAEASVRYLTMKGANLLAYRHQKQIGDAHFGEEALGIQRQIDNFLGGLHPLLAGVHEFISPFLPSLRDQDVQSNRDIYSIVQNEQILPAMYIISELHSLNLMIGHHVPSSDSNVERGFMHNNALAICKIFTALEFRPQTSNETLLPLLSSLAMAAIWMPDSQFRIWFRSKFLVLENMGFIFPISFRLYLADMWCEGNLQSSWLPYQVADSSYPFLNNGIITSIRNLSSVQDEIHMDQRYQETSRLKSMFGIL